MANSKITDVIINRLQSLKSLKEETAPIGHNSSIGIVRESRLSALLKNYLPNDIGIETGFVCDAVGGISPQIDIIITDEDPIPVLEFDKLFKLVPVEKVICCIEVKSTLTTKGLRQIELQEKSINSMPRCIGVKKHSENTIVPSVFFSGFSLDCDVAIKTLEKHLKSSLNLRQITVVGKFAIRNSHLNEFRIEQCKGNNEFIETRKSLAWLLHMISEIKEHRKQHFSTVSRRSVWEAYLGSDDLIEN